MEDKALRKLSRSDLLEIMVSVSKENEALQIENDQLKQALVDRQLKIEKAGSFAQAAIELNGVVEATQKAADQYLYNVQQLAGQIREQIRAEILNAQQEAEAIRQKAQQEAQLIIENARSQANQNPGG